MRSSQIDRSLIADGCTIEKSTIEHSIIGIRSIIDSDSILKDVILMGADEYETDVIKEKAHRPRIGIGRGCNIQRAIIDKNARIGDNVVISPEGKDEEMNGEGFYIRDGIVVIPKNSTIASGTRITRHGATAGRLRNGDGNAVAGDTKLGTLRDSYTDE